MISLPPNPNDTIGKGGRLRMGSPRAAVLYVEGDVRRVCAYGANSTLTEHSENIILGNASMYGGKTAKRYVEETKNSRSKRNRSMDRTYSGVGLGQSPPD